MSESEETQSAMSFISDLLQKPMTMDEYVNREPSLCAEQFRAMGKGYIVSYWLKIVWKVMATLTVLGAGLALDNASMFDGEFHVMDSFYQCAVGQPGFTDAGFDDDWWWTKSYLRQIAYDLS